MEFLIKNLYLISAMLLLLAGALLNSQGCSAAGIMILIGIGLSKVM